MNDLRQAFDAVADALDVLGATRLLIQARYEVRAG